MQLPAPLILEDWEDYLTGLHPEPRPTLPFRLVVEVESWPHEAADLFQRASPARPYPHSTGANPDERTRMRWALNGMRSYLTEKLEALVQRYYAVSGHLPLPSDEFIVTAGAEEDRRWAGIYAVKKRLTEYRADNTVLVRLIVAELEWEEGVTGFSHSST
ncbi:hypothetical protein GCM10023186_46160 [Hymenobacter koreensis]|uniref:Uncharacterized protein n=1 Tax=Hymenobacter koreensis TaxID=1084523 RepID=A0ABP8JPL3_9BACT